jgi:ferric-dicitrate binding protein FerR (iron transport regulator)
MSLGWLENKQNLQNSSGSSTLADFEKIWEAARVSHTEVPDVAEQWTDLQQRIDRLPSSSPNRFGFPRFAFALTAVAVLLLVFWSDLFKQHAPQTFETVRGRKMSINLDDRSVVSLNAVSSLVVQEGFNRTSREVFLTGEAYFSVEKGELPFVIYTDIAEIKVVGTKFNVFSRNGEVKVGVTEGRVEVSSEHDGAMRSALLGPGQKVSVSRQGFLSEPVPINQVYFPAWTTDRLYFEEESLTEVCEELERVFDVEIDLNLGGQDRDQNVSGLLDGETALTAISNLCNVIEKKYHFVNGKFEIY